MMATYMVNSDSVAQGAAQVAASSDRIRSEVAALMAQLLALQDSWSGIAHANFSDCITSWQATQHQVETSLQMIGTQLTNAAAVYSDAETQSASLFAMR